MKIDLTKYLSQCENFNLGASIVSRLNGAGYIAYLAGGCVRDALLGLAPKDIDIVTNALPDVVENIFANTVPIGKKFGIVLVVEGDTKIEVATFRKEDDYFDGRRPEKIEYSGPEEDSHRRDFTVNALFYDLLKHEVIDFQNGLDDLNHRVLRCVGSADKRFKEDYLRILRLFRFAVRFGFTVDPITQSEAVKNLNGLLKISQERKREELLKSLLDFQQPYKVVQAWCEWKIWSYYGLENDLSFYPEILFDDALTDEGAIVLRLLWAQSSKLDLKKWFKDFKCSVAIERYVSESLKFKTEWVKLIQEPLEDQMYYCYQYDQSHTISLLLKNMSDPQVISQKASLEQWQTWMNHFKVQKIKPLLNGNDLNAFCSGASLGKVLTMILKKQIFHGWVDKNEAMKYFESELKGKI